MKVYVDDVRLIPEGWTGARTFHEALDLIDENLDEITHISFDWNLSTEYINAPTGMDLLKELIYTHYNDRQVFVHPRENYTVHTSDPDVKKKMESLLDIVCGSTHDWSSYCDYVIAIRKSPTVSVENKKPKSKSKRKVRH